MGAGEEVAIPMASTLVYKWKTMFGEMLARKSLPKGPPTPTTHQVLLATPQ